MVLMTTEFVCRVFREATASWNNHQHCAVYEILCSYAVASFHVVPHVVGTKQPHQPHGIVQTAK